DFTRARLHRVGEQAMDADRGQKECHRPKQPEHYQLIAARGCLLVDDVVEEPDVRNRLLGIGVVDDLPDGRRDRHGVARRAHDKIARRVEDSKWRELLGRHVDLRLAQPLETAYDDVAGDSDDRSRALIDGQLAADRVLAGPQTARQRFADYG